MWVYCLPQYYGDSVRKKSMDIGEVICSTCYRQEVRAHGMQQVELRICMEEVGVKPWSESPTCDTELRFYPLGNREYAAQKPLSRV